MVKKLSVAALAAMICLPGAALAGGDYDRVADLERKMAEMQKMFNMKLQEMQREIATLKAQNARLREGAQPAAVDLSDIKADIAALKAKDEEISKDVAEAKESTAADWTKRITLGGEVRMRGYNLQNVWNFDDTADWDNWDVFRLKASLWAKAKISDDVTGFVKITDQTYGEGVAVAVPTDNLGNKVFLDNAYINVRNLLGLPVDATIGRQNLIYGTGFVILDGQSQFGSTSIYFDGVKLRWHITDSITLDGLYMKDQENNRANNVNSNSGDDITLAGGYLIAKNCPMVGQSEFYILNRHDETLKKDIWMYGARIANKMDNGFDYSLEAAIQRGDALANVDQEAWGTKLGAGYTFKDVAMQPRLYLGYAYLSGDDPNTQHNEGWDVFYGGWPQFGDLLAWKFVNIGAGNSLNAVYNYNRLSSTGGEAVYSNFSIGTIGASARLMKNLSADISYSMLTFDEVAAGADDDFGDYYQAKLNYQYNKNLSFALYGAMLNPGGAFAGADDPATEFFWESKVRF